MARPKKKRAKVLEFIPRARSIEKLALALLAIIGSTSNLILAFDHLRKLFPKLRLKIVRDDLLGAVEARAYPEQWLIKIRRGMHEGLLRGDPRARWTLAHELAHVILQHPRKMLPRVQGIGSHAPLEREADLFAANFLAPYNDNSKKLRTAEDLRDIFKISLDAAERRLEEFSAIRSRDSAAKRTEPISAAEVTSIDLDNLSDLASQAILATLNDYQSKAHPIEPLHGNLIGAGNLIAIGSKLLLDAYLRYRSLKDVTNAHKMAALAVTILIVRPIRLVKRCEIETVELMNSNHHCARLAAEALVNLPRGSFGRIELPQPNPSEPDQFESSYLWRLVKDGDRLVRGARTTVTLASQFNAKIYSSKNTVFEGDVRDIEYLIEKFNFSFEKHS